MIIKNDPSGYKKCDIAIIGAGPAGIFAAISAASACNTDHTSIFLLERNGSAAKKLLLTGNGRCNYTVDIDFDGMASAFGKKGRFFSEAFNDFSSHDLIAFFKKEGIEPEFEKSFENESLIKVFPKNKNSSSVQQCLIEKLQAKNIVVFYGYRAEKVFKVENYNETKEYYPFKIQPFNGFGFGLYARKVILATGGKTYPQTGSTGDGYKIAKNLGHSINELSPFLVPIFSNDREIHLLAGVSVKDVCIKIFLGKNIISKSRGSILFTHRGLSGPCAISIGHEVYKLLNNKYKKESAAQNSSLSDKHIQNRKAVKIPLPDMDNMEHKDPGPGFEQSIMEGCSHESSRNPFMDHDTSFNRDFLIGSIDLAPDLNLEDFKNEISAIYRSNPKKELHTSLKMILKNIPDRVLDLILTKCKISKNLKIGNLAKAEIAGIYGIFRNLEFKIDGKLHFDEAIVTEGGIPVKEINPKNMQSILADGLYFAGEIIELAGPEGGFNLQKAFSTGWLAGKSAARALETKLFL
jgi:predicted Rossmann fold flavoprotein